MSSKPAIVVDEVSKKYRLYHERNQSLKAAVVRGRFARYEEFWALRDVSFEVKEGQTFGIIGENGCGKSTLLKCMARILQPDAGRIAVTGKVSALLELGAGFHPELSGRENVYLNGAILGISKREIRSRFDDIVGFAGLEQFIDLPVKNYSSGMYVRLGFAVAINVDPDVLLFDEILAVGDAEFRQKCNEKIDELQSSGKTIVIVSHALESIRNLCDQVALLEHGVLRNVGAAGAVVDDYLDSVHGERLPDGKHGARGGSGEARIERIELINASGSAVTRVRTGDAMAFRLHYVADEPIEQPTFGLAVHRIDGVHVTGPNTRQAGVGPEKIDGAGHAEVRVDRLLLLPGTYDLTVSLHNRTLTHAYDSRVRAFRFDVEHGEPSETEGVVSLGGEWEFTTSQGTA